MKIGERLDQILIMQGFVDDEQIKRALIRQKTHGGRLGTHLLYFKYITLEKLTNVLSELYGVPGLQLEDSYFPEAVLQKLSVEMVEDLEVLPLNFDEDTGVLLLAVADPRDKKAVEKVKRIFHAKQVKVYVTPEMRLKNLIKKHYRGEENIETQYIIELPEFFNDTDLSAVEASPPEAQTANSKKSKNVLMVTKTAFLKNLLTPVFKREGLRLQVLSGQKEIRNALKKESFDHVVVSQDAVDEFSNWVRSGKIPPPQVEVLAFSKISSALLDNPVPYKVMVRSLFALLKINAENRNTDGDSLPPYDLICTDIQKLASSMGFRRIAVDGLQIAAYLLTPSDQLKPVNEASPSDAVILNFTDFDRSLDYSRTLQFPWNIHGVLEIFKDIVSEQWHLVEPGDGNAEQWSAAQVLALVWYRRYALRDIEGPPEEAAAKIKSALREKVGLLANLEITETYIHLLEQSDGGEADDRYKQIFIVSKSKNIAEQFLTRLDRSGFKTVKIYDLAEAQWLCERSAPAAILVDYESYPEEIFKTSRLFKLNSPSLLYAFTREENPSLTMGLLDAGFDDVFVAPYECNVIAACIRRSLKGLTKRVELTGKPEGFSATLKAFSFFDLLQTLGQTQKTVRISLSSGAGEKADVYLEKGQMVHAVCGQLAGVEVVYHIIRWEEDGSFTVEPEDKVPPANIFEPTEAILMEGCRLLDESRI